MLRLSYHCTQTFDCTYDNELWFPLIKFKLVVMGLREEEKVKNKIIKSKDETKERYFKIKQTGQVRKGQYAYI